MGNNQGALHKRERTGDGQQRMRMWSGSASTPVTAGSVTEDGCPVQVSILPFRCGPPSSHFCLIAFISQVDSP